jgi:hypothetical protein
MLVITIFVHISSSNSFSATKNGLVSVWYAPIAMNSSTVDVDFTFLWGHCGSYERHVPFCPLSKDAGHDDRCRGVCLNSREHIMLQVAGIEILS